MLPPTITPISAPLSDATDPVEVVRYESLCDGAASDAARARSRIADAQQRIRDAQAVRDGAAEDAIDRIRNTAKADGLKDSWWDNWGADALAVITDVAGWVATVAGVLALVVSWIPVIGQVLAAALLLVAGIAAIVNAIGNTILASSGERTWTEAVISIVGAALSVVGLGSAARIVGSAAAAGRINALARIQPGFAGEALTVRQALRVRPTAMMEAEQLWRAPLTAPSSGDDVFRLWGGRSGSGGGSWSGADPGRCRSPGKVLAFRPRTRWRRSRSVTSPMPPRSPTCVTPCRWTGCRAGGPEWVFPAGSPTPPWVASPTSTCRSWSPDMARIDERDFAHRVAITSADPEWDSEAAEATAAMPAEGPYRGFIRRADAGGIRYAYFGGRTASRRGDARVSEGLLFEVSGRLKSDPDRYPSDGRRYREIGEALVTDSPALLAELRKAYRS